MKLLTNQPDREEAHARLGELLEARGEWLCAEESSSRAPSGVARVPACVRRGEWELRLANGALHFSFWSDAGARAWRVAGWAAAGDGRLLLAVTRRGGAERARLELVPRASSHEAAAELRAARLAACERLAALACRDEAGAEVASARLSRGPRRSEPGRYARIILSVGRRGLSVGRRGSIAVTGPLAAVRAHEADAMLASALLWWSRLDEQAAGRAKFAGATRLRLVAARELSKQLAERLALLREDVRGRVALFETGESFESLTPVETPPLRQLLDGAPRARPSPAPPALSETAARLVSLAPDCVDAIHARGGETVRFRGLPFARVRRLPGGERVWFGPPGARRKLLLDEDNWPRLVKLLDDLAEHRSATAANARHEFYRAAPEAWLESVLRRDIRQLDPGLVVAPLHAQWRAPRERGGASRPVDLLALRGDGRLVVVELKVTEDAALPLQGADYWRRVEARRRNGDLARARLFGELRIADAPALVYLVAPALRFHRAFARLARLVSPDIEMYRFDINEDWRAGVRVSRRVNLDGSDGR